MKIIKKLLELWFKKQEIVRMTKANTKTITKIIEWWLVRVSTKDAILYNMDKLIKELEKVYKQDVLDDK